MRVQDYVHVLRASPRAQSIGILAQCLEHMIPCTSEHSSTWRCFAPSFGDRYQALSASICLKPFTSTWSLLTHLVSEA